MSAPTTADLIGATKADVFLQLACGALSNARAQLVFSGTKAQIKQAEVALSKAENLRVGVFQRRARINERLRGAQ